MGAPAHTTPHGVGPLPAAMPLQHPGLPLQQSHPGYPSVPVHGGASYANGVTYPGTYVQHPAVSPICPHPNGSPYDPYVTADGVMLDYPPDFLEAGCARVCSTHQLLKLMACVGLDLAGDASYMLPFEVGELTDLAFAPMQGLMLRRMFNSDCFAALGVTEELLPFVDIIPTCTIGWILSNFCPYAWITRVLGIGSVVVPAAASAISGALAPAAGKIAQGIAKGKGKGFVREVW